MFRVQLLQILLFLCGHTLGVIDVALPFYQHDAFTSPQRDANDNGH